MPTLPAPIPTPLEIREQLAVMTLTNVFKRAPGQVKLLAYIVEAALGHKDLTEQAIGKALLGRKYRKDETTNIRVTARNLRNSIDVYYASEGRHDKVVISFTRPPSDRRVRLSPGEAYKPSFKYNPDYSVARAYDAALYHLRAKTPGDFLQASIYFRGVIREQQDHVEALIGAAEAACLESFFYTPASASLKYAARCAEIALELRPEYWRANLACGFVHCFLRKEPVAILFFTKALKLDSGSTLASGWTHLFLYLTGNSARAAELARMRAERAPHDSLAQALHGFYLYLVRDLRGAEEVAQDIRFYDHTSWLAALLRVLIAIAETPQNDQMLEPQFESLEATLDTRNGGYAFPALRALSHPRLRADARFIESVHGELETWLAGGEPPLNQGALVALAFDEPEAWELLRQAWNDLDPVMLFLQQLPLFDRWRETRKFQEFLRATDESLGLAL